VSAGTENLTLSQIKVKDPQPGSGLYRILATGYNLEVNDITLDADAYREIFIEPSINKTFEYTLSLRTIDKNVDTSCTLMAEDYCHNNIEYKLELPHVSRATNSTTPVTTPENNNYALIVLVTSLFLIAGVVIFIAVRRKRTVRSTHS
jgi:hypothetical protein